MRIRIGLVIAAALFTTACSTSRTGRGADVEGSSVVTSESVPSASARASGPMDAGSLGQELGLEVQDAFTSVLFKGDTMRARVFPGRDLLLIDGRSVAMGEAARRDGSSVTIPASGVDAIRRAMAASRVAPPVIQPLTPIGPVAVRFPGAKAIPSVAKGAATAGDPAWLPLPGAETRPWKWIVVHHSDDVSGCCSKYDACHRAKGWDECGYHFVIGNGSMTGDGQVEVTTRWPVQKHGAHAKTPDNRFNDFGVGIVLVGDFEKGPGPSAAQYASLLRLTRWLMARYDISSDRVMRHGDAKSTACPGRNFPWSRYQRDLVAMTASIGSEVPTDRHASLGSDEGPVAGSDAALTASGWTGPSAQVLIPSSR